MAPFDAARELASFDAELELHRASTPPSSWYTTSEWLELEERTVFARAWHPAARLDQLCEPGQVAVGSAGREPWLLLRHPDGELRALANVCRHHAAEVCPEAGNVERLVCPYHGWTYDLDGRLLKAPGLGAARDFERADFALPRLRSAGLGPLALICADAEASELEAEDPELRAVLAELDEGGWTGLTPFAQRRSVIECNWKVYVDNYLDGGYHVPVLHGDLAARLDLESYETRLLRRAALQSADGSRDAQDERVGRRALYLWLYPALMINRYGPFLDTNQVRPLGPERCEVRMDYWVEPGRAGDAAFLERSLARSQQVQDEDVRICESVQRGLRSASYERGRYSPRHEGAMHHFHRLLARDLAREP